MNPFDLVIQHGTLVRADEIILADVGIREGIIVEIGRGLSGRRNIDASGMFVFPGAIDPHVHLNMPFGDTFSSDNWTSGTIAAAYGGTTTVIDFVEPDPGEPLLEALGARRSEADGASVVDYGLHMTIREDRESTLAQIPEVIAAGCPSFKTYLTYAGFKLDDSALLNVLTAVAGSGGLTLVHAENDAIVEYYTRRLVREGKEAIKYFPQSRPAIAEKEAIHLSLTFAGLIQAPVYIVHISTAGGVKELQLAREQGVTAFGETCPQYLLLSEVEFERAGFEGARYLCAPPLRTKNDQASLWKALSEGLIQSVGTDHCPFNYRGQKDRQASSFTKIPPGLPGIESRLALLFTYGYRSGFLSLPQLVSICSTNPARIFNLYPQKGELAPGTDADIVIFDPEHNLTLSREYLHERVDYTPYEGFKLHGYPYMTLLRGNVIVERGKFVGQIGSGRFLPRRTVNPHF